MQFKPGSLIQFHPRRSSDRPFLALFRAFNPQHALCIDRGVPIVVPGLVPSLREVRTC